MGGDIFDPNGHGDGPYPRLFSSEDSLGPELLWQGWPPSPATGRHPWFLLRVLTVLYQWPRMVVSMLLQLIGFNLVFAIQGGALFSRMSLLGWRR